MTKEILYIATSDIHLATFHKPYLLWLSEQGYQVDIAIENRGNYKLPGITNTYNLPFPRTILRKDLISTYKQLKRIIDNGKYDLVHCHTPIPSMLTRIAARSSRKKGTKVLYTAHGFHFYKGATLKRWLFYYTAEYFLSAFTDGIITINREDYNYINGKMLHKDSFYIKGIGVDSSRFKPLSMSEKSAQRNKLGYSSDQYILLYIAEFIPRKNHEFLIKALPELKKRIPNLKVIFAGTGVLFNKMKKLSEELVVSDAADFLGFQKDVHLLASIADVGISSSKHEGLGLGLAEQMMCRVPIIATVDRGHKEMIDDGVNGYFFNQGDMHGFVQKVLELYNDEGKRNEMAEQAYVKSQLFDISSSLKSMKEIYNYYLK